MIAAVFLCLDASARAARLDGTGSGYTFGGTTNLTTVGTSDWGAWDGPACSNSNHKATGGGQISDCTVLNGTSSQFAFSTDRQMAWTDGTPAASNPGDTNVIYTNGPGAGFSLIVPADTTVRTLYVYAEVATGVTGTFTATLSDNSAPQYTDSSFSGVEVTYGVIYQAASAGQTLTLTWTGSASGTSFGVRLYGAALQVGAAALTITTSSPLTAATQYQSYSNPALSAWGGTPPYSNWTVTTANDTLPEGMTMNSSNGAVSSSAVGGEGSYLLQAQVTDSVSATATKNLTINVAGDNTLGGCSIFPSDTIFHRRIDSLPVDTSPAAAIPAANQTSHIQLGFGNDPDPPDGIPFIRVPYNQPLVTMTFTLYPGQSDPGPYPFPGNAPIEDTANRPGWDQHVLVLQTAGGGQPCKLYEVWQGTKNFDGSWDASNGAYWNLASDALRPQGWTSGDAAGLPIMPLLVTYDETVGGGIQHPIRFTINHTLADFVWPARHSAGSGHCTDAGGNTLQNVLISQATPPVSCTVTAPMGEIYRLKAGVDTSICNGKPQAAAILVAMKQYGIILADNGPGGDIIGTPDSRWNNTDLACLGNFTLSQFEPVNISSLQINPDSGASTSPPASYTLTLNATNGTVSANPNLSSYPSGMTVTLTATPNSGYSFSGWSGDVTGNANPTTLVMDSDKSVTAGFSFGPGASGSGTAPKAYPNPFRPSPGSGQVTLANLPAGATVSLFTLTGNKVRELTADSNGTALWDANNESGSPVASGIYLAIVQGGGTTTKMKIAILR